LQSGFYAQPAGSDNKPRGNPVNIDPSKYLKVAKDARPEVLLFKLGLSLVAAIMTQKEVVVVLSLVSILAIIVLTLVIGSLRRH
jgi:hypothetical protein